MLDDHYIRQGDLSQRMKDAGATGAIAGFALFESGNTMIDDTNIVPSKKTTTDFIAGHPNWCHRVQDWGVPVHLQDAHYGGHEKLGKGIGYKYAHDYPNHYVDQQYLPSEIQGSHFYELSDMGYEKTLKEHMKHIRGED